MQHNISNDLMVSAVANHLTNFGLIVGLSASALMSQPSIALSAGLTIIPPPATAQIDYSVYPTIASVFSGNASAAFYNTGSPGIGSERIAPDATTMAYSAASPAAGVLAFAHSSTQAEVYANAYLTFYAEIVGPADVSVPIIINGGIVLSSTAGSPQGLSSHAMGSLTMGYAGAVGSLGSLQNSGGTPPSNVMQISAHESPLSDTIISFTLTAQTFAGLGASASASVDPTIIIDPNFAQASQYSVVLSPGIGNSSVASVPEPSTWTLMLAGMGGLARVARVRKRKNRENRYAESSASARA